MIMTTRRGMWQFTRNPRSLSLTSRIGPVGYRRVGGLAGLGQATTNPPYLDFGGNGQVLCGGIDSSLCNANVLQQAVAYSQGQPLSAVNAQCNMGGVSGSGCVGQLRNVAQWLQNGNITYSNGDFAWCGPGGGTWNGPVNSTCTPTPPSQLAATQYAGQTANDPFMAGMTVPTVPSGQQAQPLSPAPPQPSTVNYWQGLAPWVVQPSPSTQLTTTGTAATNPLSLVSQANGTVATSGTLASTVGGLFSGQSTLIPGIPDWIVIAVAVVGGFILLTKIK
jgi:hypothetical protein